MGDFSTELCGGTHASRTGDIGLFRILSESGTAAGIRRIEAVTGAGAIATLHQQSDLLQDVAQLVKGDSNTLTDKVRSVLDRTRALERTAAAERSAGGAGKRVAVQPGKMVNGVKLLVSQLTMSKPKCCAPWWMT